MPKRSKREVNEAARLSGLDNWRRGKHALTQLAFGTRLHPHSPLTQLRLSGIRL